VRLFLVEGASVVIADMNAENGETLAAELGEQFHFCAVDLAQPEQIGSMVAQAVEFLGGPASRGKYRRWYCSSHRAWPAMSPGRRLRWTAA
jgi:NAD(P)-dependent dehydrogenase (short-subunit alcohol dehydrogenase family)